MPTQRCINIDWLEVYCLEPITNPRTMDYFRSCGFGIINRGYGTRIYEEMFTLVGTDDYPLIEIRRSPKSTSVMAVNACHVRFVNRTCYYYNAGELMRDFLIKYGFEFVSISRIDICLDFEKFDKGDDPQKFVKRYIGHKYAKINQSQATAHFDDQWERREFNSLSWGSKNSHISTKLYNKTVELYDDKLGAFKKPYIIQSWFECRLIDDPIKVVKVLPDGKTYRPQIWRLEFSIQSDVKGWFAYRIDGDSKKIRSIRHTLETYLNRDLLLPIFDLLQQHYFHFKKHVAGRVKYDCKDKILFDFSSDEKFYRVEHPSSPKKPDALIIRLQKYLQEYLSSHPSPELQQAGSTILERLEKENASRLNYDTYSTVELEALKRVIALRLSGADQDPVMMAQDIIHLLKTHSIF